MEIPIITTKAGGNVELIENGKEGILVGHNDKEELKKRIIELAKDDALRNRLLGRAKIKVTEFSQERMLGETVKNIMRILNLSLDKTVLDKNSKVSQRIVEYEFD